MNIIIPGIHGSDEKHWQSLWEREFPTMFHRVVQADWNNPDCDTWTLQIEQDLSLYSHGQLILIGHSVGCATIIHWLKRFDHRVKGVLLIAPSDVDRYGYPPYITGFSPMPLERLSCPGIVVASSNDHVVNIERARHFSDCWGCEFVELDSAGHIEPKSGFGEWPFGLELLKRLQ